MKNIILKVLYRYSSFFILTQSVFALASDPRLMEVRKICIEGRDWSEIQCQKGVNLDPMYQVTPGISIGDVNYPSTRVTGAFNDIATRLNPSVKRQGEKLYSNLLRMLQTTIIQHNLQSCQIPCLVTCATSTYLRFDQERIRLNKGGRPSLAKILIDGKATCVGYALLSKLLANDLGANTHEAVSDNGDHAFLGVNLEGLAFYMEPQSPSCYFMNQENDKTVDMVMATKALYVEKSETGDFFGGVLSGSEISSATLKSSLQLIPKPQHRDRHELSIRISCGKINKVNFGPFAAGNFTRKLTQVEVKIGNEIQKIYPVNGNLNSSRLSLLLEKRYLDTEKEVQVKFCCSLPGSSSLNCFDQKNSWKGIGEYEERVFNL